MTQATAGLRSRLNIAIEKQCLWFIFTFLTDNYRRDIFGEE